MTGIERLREFAKGCRLIGQNAYSNAIGNIADQIEREQGGRVSRMRVLAVVTDMERHVSGVEGMEDSPVARWARELREALGGDGRDHAADVSVSAYDLLPQEDREAIAWVREHGGIESVKAQRRESMPRAAYERKKAGFLDHIAECEAALGRRRVIISELNHRASDLTRENAKLSKRAMPEGCEWPRYESGELVCIGDVVSDVEVRSVVFRDGGILLSDCTSVPGWGTWRSYKEPIKRPAVLAADGEPLEVGQTVWDENGDELVIGAIENGGHTVTCRYADVGDGIPTHGMWSPSDLTHRAPVLAADGLPLREGETVWMTDGSERHVVLSTEVDGIGSIVTEVQAPGAVKVHISPSRLTHERPDSWERIEEDAGCTATKYNERRGTIFTTKQQVARDLVRRCRALAERERGE